MFYVVELSWKNVLFADIDANQLKASTQAVVRSFLYQALVLPAILSYSDLLSVEDEHITCVVYLKGWLNMLQEQFCCW